MLASVYPLVLITVVLERGRVKRGIRARMWTFELLTRGTVTLAVIGLVVSIVGLQLGGYEGSIAGIGWVLFGLTVAGLLALLSAIMAVDGVVGGGTLPPPASSDAGTGLNGVSTKRTPEPPADPDDAID